MPDLLSLALIAAAGVGYWQLACSDPSVPWITPTRPPCPFPTTGGCGACSATCPGGTCPAGQTCSGGTCQSCGACSATCPTGACPTGQTCSGGTCQTGGGQVVIQNVDWHPQWDTTQPLIAGQTFAFAVTCQYTAPVPTGVTFGIKVGTSGCILGIACCQQTIDNLGLLAPAGPLPAYFSDSVQATWPGCGFFLPTAFDAQPFVQLPGGEIVVGPVSVAAFSAK